MKFPADVFSTHVLQWTRWIRILRRVWWYQELHGAFLLSKIGFQTFRFDNFWWVGLRTILLFFYWQRKFFFRCAIAISNIRFSRIIINFCTKVLLGGFFLFTMYPCSRLLPPTKSSYSKLVSETTICFKIKADLQMFITKFWRLRLSVFLVEKRYRKHFKRTFCHTTSFWVVFLYISFITLEVQPS